ncbi:hypothetical protein PsYK624_017330 [Phanerochaete sordida]|uniref:FHA domain-containing protein n=1 Tax=Phanerochaete sordida TaxID=48140 RepID=A0A9P3G0V4_9APHY|nr:hypothetical protein PsYK624_017330 [Phanerochaete sordida]
MWTVSGPFDGEEEKKVDFQRTKLLRPGNSYIVARKVGQLVIKHPSVSRKHLVFEVGECSEEDIENPEFIPKLTLHNPGASRKVLHIDDNETPVNKDGSVALQDGDRVLALQDIPLTVKWKKVVCCCPPTITDVKTQDCAKLGISVIPKPHPSINYHLIPTYTLTPAIATSLLNAATFVKPSWLTELISHYAPLTTPDPGKEYHVPSLSKHRPAFSPALPSSLKNHRSWEPNEARANMLKGHRVVFVGERGREAPADYKELVKQGGGAYECCAVQGGRKALHGVLAKAQGKDATIALVADAAAMVAAVGQDEWDGIVEEATGYGLRFVTADKLVQTVVHIDLAYIDCASPQHGTGQSSGSLPDVVLNTHPDEPSIPPSHPLASSSGSAAARPELQAEVPPEPEAVAPLPRKLVRRTVSQRPSVEPSSSSSKTTPAPEATPSSEPPAEEQPFKLPRRLVRRTVTKANDNVIVGVGDTSMAVDGSSSTPATAQPIEDILQIRRPFNLKRRHGSTAPAAQPAPAPPSQLVVEKPSGEEPPHKRFQALYEQSDPDRLASQAPASQAPASASAAPSSQTQPESAARARTRELASVPEDVEMADEAAPVPPQRASQKRKVRDEDADVEMGDAPPRPAKRRGTSKEPAAPPQAQAPKVFTNAANKPASASQKGGGAGAKGAAKRGAAGGAPDRDEAFLKAVASTKRGKRLEDDFDREFNNLRIAKPEVPRVDPAEQWKILDDFGDDRDVRGNFMVVVEADLVRKDRRAGGGAAVAHGGGRMDWEGRPNFKKFKKKAIGERPKPIELVPSNEDDLLGFKSEEDDDDSSFPTRSQRPERRAREKSFSPVKPKPKPQSSLKRARDSDSEVEEAIAPKSQKVDSKGKASQPKASQSKAPQSRSSQSKAPPSKASQAKPPSRVQKKSTLFVESDPDEDEDDTVMAVDKNPSQRSQHDDEDSDDDFSQNSTLRTQSQRRSQWSGAGRREGPPAEDSDDDMAFKGFGGDRSQRPGRSQRR